MMDEYRFNPERRRDFNKRAVYYRNLHSDLGFNLKESGEATDFTCALLTEYADISGDTEGMARLAIAVDFLQDGPADQLQERLSELVNMGWATKKQAHLREFVFSVSGDAARSIKRRLADSTEDDRENSSSILPHTGKYEQTSKKSPNYADPEDVVKYLFEVGCISPSHAAALLVTFGYYRPEQGITEELMNDVIRIRTDLRARIMSLRDRRVNIFEETGLKVIEMFIAKSAKTPDLRLRVENDDVMISVGSAIASLHLQGDVRSSPLPERADKYDGTGVIISSMNN